MSRLSWTDFFIRNAFLMSERATCERLKVGAVIVQNGKHIIASGYNGSIEGDEHCIDVGCKVVDNHCIRTIHAEENAIYQCAEYGISTKGADIYVTHFPCLKCAKAIIRAKIKRVFYAEDYKNNAYALELFKKAGVDVVKCEVK
jgi:dCMP deaminase